MGVFSWNCHSCGLSILNNMVDEGETYSQATVIFPDGSIIHGSYNGYGRIGGRQLNDCITGDNGTFYHTACWKGDGSPLEYHGPSPSAEDQGHFTDQRAHYGCSECGSSAKECPICISCEEPSCLCIECPYCGQTCLEDNQGCDLCGRYIHCGCDHTACEEDEDD